MTYRRLIEEALPRLSAFRAAAEQMRLVVYGDPLTGLLARAWVYASAVSLPAPPVDAGAR